MESAFGIDHGYSEIDKAWGMGALTSLGGKMAGAATGAGNTLRRAGASNLRSSKSLALAPGQAKRRAATGGMKMGAGGALKKLGQGMAAKPGLAGGLAVGGAAGGLGGGAALMSRRRTY
jgi:hypothetical protein